MTQKSAKTQPTSNIKGGGAGTGAENEVEKGRDMGEWRRVLDLLEIGRIKQPAGAGAPGATTTTSSSSSSNPNDILVNFLFNEAKLEAWLEDHQPTEKYMAKAKAGLIDIKKGLQNCLSHAGDQSGLKTDVRVLLAKVYYASGLYEEALDELDKSEFEKVCEVAQSVRNLQLMAEANAIKAHCLEKVGKSLRGKQSLPEPDRKKEILKSYNKSADLAIAFFQGQEKLLSATYPSISIGNSPFPNVNVTLNSNTTAISSSGGTSPNPQQWEKRRPSSLLDFAIRRGPTLLLEDTLVDDAVTRIQKLVRSCDTHFFTPIRLLLYRRLAEILLRHKWIQCKLTSGEANGQRLKYHVGASLYNPRNLWEEIFLILLLSESLVVKEGVLNQAPEFAKARKLANLNAASIFDLLGLAAGRWGQYYLLNEGLEQALKFSFEEPHVWSQYGLSFIACGYNTRKSNQTLIEAAKLSSKPTPLLLLAAQQAFGRLLVDEGMSLIKQAKEKEVAGNQRLISRVYLYEGVGYFLTSFERHMNQQRLNELQASLSSLQKSVEIDPSDYLGLHWLARVHAWNGNINDAFTFAVKALKAYPFHLPTLQLIVLLLTAQRNYPDALAITEEALDEYSDHLGFLQIKAALDQKLFGPDNALGTVRQMLIVWKSIFDDGHVLGARARSDSPEYKTFGAGTLQLPSPTDRESSVASFRAGSIAGSSTNAGTLTSGFRQDAALSEIASSVSMHGQMSMMCIGDLAWTAQINIWIMLTDLYLKMDKPLQAAYSIEEAAQIASAHPDVLFYRGKIEEHQENYREARVWYESAVGVKPTHVKALQSLALMQHYFGSHRLAEKTLQDALKLDPYDHHTWYNLGKVLEALGECSEAGDCMATALDIESMNPILPYSIIPICFE